MDIAPLEARAQEIRAGLWLVGEDGKRQAPPTTGAAQATISLLVMIYGTGSPQLANFRERLAKGLGQHDGTQHWYYHRIAGEIESVLDAALADLRAGTTGHLVARAKGEVLGDFIALARIALASGTPESLRVAAVLASGAFEESLKQLGEVGGADVYNRDVRGVIQKLKDASLLSGTQANIAVGHVKLRDTAFHGQFADIDSASVTSMLAFTEGIVLERFG